MQNNNKIDESVILDALLSLPQSQYFKPEHIKRFMDVRKDDPRALWHVARLAGIGGSEIGALVSALRGEADPFGTTPESIACEKLLVFPPKKTSIAMRKGIVAETCIRQFFLEDYKATRDMESISMLESADVKTPYPWMRYSPDDIVFLAGRRYLVDYKRPAEATLHDNILMRYICQLHQGKMILDYNSVHIDGMLLVQFPENGDDLVVSEVTMDDSIADDIVKAGSELWNDVLAGKLKPYSWQEDLPHELDADDQQKLSEYSNEFTRTKAMIDALGKDLEVFKTKITDIVTAKSVPPGKIALNGMNIGVTNKFGTEVAAQAIGDDAVIQAKVPVYSADAMRDHLVKLGVNMQQFESGEFVWDEKMIREMLFDRGMKDEQFTTQSLRMTLSCTKEYKEAAQVAVTTVRNNFPVVSESSRKAKPKP